VKKLFFWGLIVGLSVQSLDAMSQTSKTEYVEFTSSGATEDEAIANGVKDMLNRVLESVIGDEAAGDLGERFYAAYGNDPVRLRERYFTSDFRPDCGPSGKFVRCLIEGEVKFSAIDHDVKKLMRGLTSQASLNLMFNDNESVPKNPRNDKLVTAIGRELETAGHRFERKEDNDFYGVSMKITGIRFVGFRYDQNTLRQEGALDVNFELWYVYPLENGSKADRRIASDVATVSSYAAGTNPAALEAELETRLITAAARSFSQKVNSQIVTFMQDHQ